MRFWTWAQGASMIQSGQTLGIGYNRPELDRHFGSGNIGGLLEGVKKSRDVAEDRDLARNCEVGDIATEVPEFRAALLTDCFGAASGSHGDQEAGHKLLRNIADQSDESAVRRIVGETASTARFSRMTCRSGRVGRTEWP